MSQLAKAFVENGAASAISAERLDSAGLAALDAGAWDALSASALVENPFYARAHLLAAMRTVERRKRIGAVVFHDNAGQVVGLFPYQGHSKVPFPLPVANSATGDYLLSGAPLVHKDHGPAVIGHWAELVAGGRLPGLWAFADFNTESRVALLMLDAARTRRLTLMTIEPYDRAYLTRVEGGFEAHLEQVLSKNRLKDVRRTLRRLQEAGTVSLEHVEGHPRLKPRLEEFLALEHAGWKGAQGTSFLSRLEHAQFAREAYGEGPQGYAALDSLLLAGRPIAMKLSIRTGSTAFTPKIAYDEALKKLGPGMALEYLLIEAFYKNTTLTGIDAAATAEGHSALNFFNGQKTMATLIVARHGWQAQALALAHRQRQIVKRQLGSLLKRVKPAQGTSAPASGT